MGGPRTPAIVEPGPVEKGKTMNAYRATLCVFAVALAALVQIASYGCGTGYPWLVGDISIQAPDANNNLVDCTVGIAGQTQFTLKPINTTEDCLGALPGLDYDTDSSGEIVQDTVAGQDNLCNYVWYVGNSPSFSDPSTTGFGGTQGPGDVTYTFQTAGTYYVFMKVNDPGVIYDDPPRIVSTEVTIEPPGTPTISFTPSGGGTYCTDCVDVQISCSDPGAAVWYTTDGTDPVEGGASSRQYDPLGMVVVPLGSAGSTTTLNAEAFYTGGSSGVYSATYTKNTNCPGPGGGGTTYDYWEYQPVQPPGITNLRVTGIYEPKTITIAWDETSLGGATDTSFDVKRIDGVTPTDLTPNTTAFSYVDSFDFFLGGVYQYEVTGNGGQGLTYGLPEWDVNNPPGPKQNYSILEVPQWGSSSMTITVIPQSAVVLDNGEGVVDSRLDLREDTDYPNPYLNYQFASSTYHGGLFVGNPGGTDHSGVARSFLKFNVTPAFSGTQRLWAASVDAYCTQALTAGTQATVGLHLISSDTWSGDAIRWLATTRDPSSWETAPSLTPSAPDDTVTVGGTGGLTVPTWCHWDHFQHEILGEMDGDHTLSVGLATTNEGQPGWLYFAKKEYHSGQWAPEVLYAYGDAPVHLVEVVVASSSVQGGKTLLGKVYINAPAPSGGLEVELWGSGCTAYVPSPIWVQEGMTSANFVVSTGIVSSNTAATVTGSAGGYRCSAGFTVTPLP